MGCWVGPYCEASRCGSGSLIRVIFAYGLALIEAPCMGCPAGFLY